MRLLEYLVQDINAEEDGLTFRTRGEFVDFIVDKLGWVKESRDIRLTNYIAITDQNERIRFDVFVNFATGKDPDRRVSMIFRDPMWNTKTENGTYISNHAKNIATEIKEILDDHEIEYTAIDANKNSGRLNVSIRFILSKCPFVKEKYRK